MRLPIALLALATCSAVYGAAPALPPSAKGPFEVLKNADTFCDEHVGYAGVTPPEVTALRSLVKEKEAGGILTRLLEEASVPGKLYALCGLYFCNYAEFQRSIKPFRTSKGTITTFMGCIRGEESVADLVERREPGVVRLAGPKDSLRDWLSKHPAAKDNGFRVDIYGGGWPELLVRGRESLKPAEPGGAANVAPPHR
jgi:hypothetical protein